MVNGEMSQSDIHQQQDEEIRKSLEQIKNKILVMSGKGGVGKSSVALVKVLRATHSRLSLCLYRLPPCLHRMQPAVGQGALHWPSLLLIFESRSAMLSAYEKAWRHC